MNGKSIQKSGTKQGVIFALIKDGKICLEKRTKVGSSFFGYTIIPGGGMEVNERQKETLLREVKEEYGVSVSKFQKLGTIRTHENGRTSNLRHVFLVSDWVGELGNPENINMHLEVTLEEARKICKHPLSQQILDLVEDKLSRKD